jgi:hypothetical protein
LYVGTRDSTQTAKDGSIEVSVAMLISTSRPLASFTPLTSPV